MITHISIRDFAIIRDLDIDLGGGLSVFTGETGAGKSIIIEAISMALGSRADTDYIRRGAQKAVITLVLDGPEGQPVVLRREISQGSRSLCRIDGEIVSLAELSAYCARLVDVHGQYDHQSLLDPDRHTAVLDLYGGADVAQVKAIVSDVYRSFVQTSGELRAVKSRLADAKRRQDLLQFEIREIDAAKVEEGEDERLASEIRVMQSSEAIFQALYRTGEALTGEYAAQDALGRAMAEIASVESLSPQLADLSQRVSDVYYQLDDLSGEIRRTRDAVSFSQEELEEKLDRADLLERLKRKYGGSLSAVLAHREEAGEELAMIETADARSGELERKLLMYKEQYDLASARLTALRTQAAELLSKEVSRELADLNFRDAVFEAHITKIPASENGSSKAEFRIAANRGEEPKPLAKIASGGEISRVMLALKRILSDLDDIPTLIFDEIDAGISGHTAGVVAEKLASIAQKRQVLCITHLPQIAAHGDAHLRIVKRDTEDGVETTVVPIAGAERVEEIARLLSGVEITDAAREQARELLRSAGKGA